MIVRASTSTKYKSVTVEAAFAGRMSTGAVRPGHLLSRAGRQAGAETRDTAPRPHGADTSHTRHIHGHHSDVTHHTTSINLHIAGITLAFEPFCAADPGGRFVSRVVRRHGDVIRGQVSR